ncbi:DNA-entry nuclease [Paenibacillus thailandensis]|uniref:DNA-entry nuclease n=1 Tax=Paenibacillus thailandensis TaxID=393250 RepID=A0ABW5QX42_9BACL
MKTMISVLSAAVIAFAVYLFPTVKERLDPPGNTDPKADVTIRFPADRYPETGEHIREAIDSGESAVCTIDREGAEENRKESLEGIPTRKGYDRDEWPMAMCAEGGAGADVAYIDPSDNRGAGSWVGNRLEQYPDGTTVLFVIE